MWRELRDELHPQGFEVVTVALDVEVDAARPFVEAASPTHPSLIDPGHLVDERLGVVNVPNGVWIDEEGVIVRPAEPAWPGATPLREQLANLDVATLPPVIGEMIEQTRKIRVDPEAYRAALLDWVARGTDSPSALSPDEVVRRSQPRRREEAEAAARFELGQHLHGRGDHSAAIGHWREAHRLAPDNWTYKRQAWELEDPGRQGRTDAYDGSWLDDVKAMGAENYYPPSSL